MKKGVLFKNFHVVTEDESMKLKVLSHGFVAIAQNKIIYVGSHREEALEAFETFRKQMAWDVFQIEEYEGKNKLILPTFANSHSHIPMVLMRNAADDMALENWLFNSILPREAHLREEDIYYASLLGMAELIDGGTGVAADMYFKSEQTIKAALETGFRMNLCCDGKNFIEDKWTSDKNALARFKKDFDGIGEGLIKTSLMVHSIYLYPDYLYPELVAEAKEVNVPIQVHIAETKVEVSNCLAKYKKTPVAALADFGIFDQPTIGAHGVHLSPEDLVILKEKEVTVVHNPSSNLKLASGFAPVQEMIDAGINVALGTDGAASNNNLDMYIEMRLASFIAKGKSFDPEKLSAHQVLLMATKNGYKGMGFKGGIIKEGMLADLQIVDGDRPSMWPLNNPISALVFSTPSAAVESVMIDGKFVKYKGELTTIDIEKIKAETRIRADFINGKA